MGRLGRIHDRYVLRGLVLWVGLTFAGIALLIVAIDLTQNIDEVAAHVASSGFFATIWLTLKLYSVRVMSYGCEFGPAIFLLGAGFCTVSLARGNEFVGLLASGVSMKRQLAPALVLAGVSALVFAGLKEAPLPELNRLEKEWTRRLRGGRRRTLRAVLVRAAGGGVLVVEEYDAEARLARGFVWWEGGRFVVADEARWEEERSSWVFPHEGKVFDYEGGEVGTRLDELRTSTGPEAFEFERLGPQVLTLGQLSRVGGRKARTALHARLSDVLSWVILVALGLPVVVRYAGRNALTGAGLCFLLAGGYEFASRGGLVFAGDGTLPAWLGAWGPKLVFGCLAGALYSMSDRG